MVLQGQKAQQNTRQAKSFICQPNSRNCFFFSKDQFYLSFFPAFILLVWRRERKGDELDIITS